MKKYILGKKIGMSQIWKEDKVIPVTLIEAGPVTVTQIRTVDKDGYTAVQVGFGTRRKVNKAQAKEWGDLGRFRHVREFRIEESGEAESLPKVGAGITVENFEEGDYVKIRGTSKGRGFQGVVKRHNFGGGPATHGQKHTLRAPGSIGAQDPQRVIKGKRMAGHMGADTVTIKGLKVVGIDPDKNLLIIKGAVPGNKGELLEIVAN